MSKTKNDILLDVKDLHTYFFTEEGIVKAVDGVSFEIKTGETIGLVGESGCGKTTIALTLLGLVPKTEGDILLNGEILPLDYSNTIRKKIQMVFHISYL